MSLTKRYILLFLCSFSMSMVAQQTTEMDMYDLQLQAEVKGQIVRLTTELNQLSEEANRQTRYTEKNLQSAYFVRMMDEKAQSLARRMQAFDVRWEAFSVSYLAYVAGYDTLMEMVTHAQLLKQTVADTITIHTERCGAIKDFIAAERSISDQDSVYAQLYKQAFALSFVQKMAPQLEKLKAQEQLRFTELQAQYDKAKAAADLVPQLQQREAILNERFYTIKSQSEKIQEMKYMPLMQRVKDYLLGLACVAMILLFVNTLITKWQAAKKNKETLAKQAEMLKKQNDYPTI